MNFNQSDIELFSLKNISIQKIEEQLNLFKKGFPFLNLIAAATLKSGIVSIENTKKYSDEWDKYLSSGKKITKFVPASGAATRMFKDLFEYLNNPEDTLKNNKNIATFINNLNKFAFYTDLDNVCIAKHSRTITKLIQENDERIVIEMLLSNEGLNYGSMPKGLLKFHSYPDGSKRTPVEEHLVEGFQYAKNNNGVNIHFTVSPEHRDLFENLALDKSKEFNQKFNTHFHITFSEQKSSTDTIAVDMENNPFRDNGKILFRPAGHGALLENLNDIDADIIFIKNIDNVLPDSHKTEEILYKKTIAGYLINIQKQVYEYLKILENTCNKEKLLEIETFCKNVLNIKNTSSTKMPIDKKIDFLKKKLNRPIRICGMVKNSGEPGGGPFFIKDDDNNLSLQILESSQIDKNNSDAMDIMSKSTHFNPVDLVCSVKDYKGNKFNLKEYTDPQTGFISIKSKNGKELKALELPGLWNGSMANWNTVFVEVPLSTFNPVKTVLDLLRAEHQ